MIRRLLTPLRSMTKSVAPAIAFCQILIHIQYVRSASREGVAERAPALTVPPPPPLSQDAWKKWERQQASKRSTSSTKGPKGDSAKGGGGGTSLGRYSQMFLQPPKPNLLARGLGIWLFVFPDGNGLHVREPHGTSYGVPPPDPKAGGSRHCDGGAHGGEICPSRELEDPLASQQRCPGLLGPEALPLVGRAPGCDLSDPS